ncbi:hypothetical protein [Amycolatopsis sp. NPDC051903]
MVSQAGAVFASKQERVWSIATVLTRLALAAGFLSAVADRFGW